MLKIRAKVALFLLVVLTALPLAPVAVASEASKLYKQGKKAERKGDLAQAYLLYSKAAALAPQKELYWLRSQAVRSRAALQSKLALPAADGDSTQEPPETEEEPAAAEPITEKDLRDARRPLPPAELKAEPGRKAFNLKAPPKDLFEQVTKAFGLDIVFDGDFPDGGAPLTFRIDEADYREALYALETLTSSFVIPVSERLVLVAKDTQQKRNDVDPAVTVVVAIPQTVTVQEAQELARSVQQVMDIKRFGIDSARRLILLNGPVSKVRPAQELFENLAAYRPQVSVDLEFIEATRTDSLSYGLNLPSSFSLVPLTTFFNSAPSVPAGLNYVFRFGGGLTPFGIGIAASMQVVANFNKANARTLLKTTMRSVDGLPATFHVGQKYPILTAGYFGPSSFSGPGAYTPPPSFTFEDLGLVIKLTPKIHGIDEVSLEVEAEFKVLAGQALNGIPIIASRKFTSRVRLKDDETALVAGLMSTDEARTISGIAGLSQIPGFGAFLRRTDKSHDADQVLLLMRPHLLNLPPDESLTRAVWVGSETRPLDRL